MWGDMNVLWLASWYPSKHSPLNGDFIKRHAQAVSLFNAVHVIHVARVSNKHSVQKNATRDKKYLNLTEVVHGYFLPSVLKLDKIYSYCFSFFLYRRYIKKYIEEKGKPDLIHVHVSLQCAIVALYFKWRYNISFIITEHSSAFLKPQNIGSNFFNNHILKKAFKNADVVTSVSTFLATSIEKKVQVKQIEIIPNVVDTSIFFYAPKPVNDTPVFLHISTLRNEKNPFQILEAFSILKHRLKKKFHLQIVGPERNDLKSRAKELHISNDITWLKETTQQDLAKLMQCADAHILYSKFETFGCVNIEAMACGLVTIVSDIATFREYLVQETTSIFVSGHQPNLLANALSTFITSSNFNKQDIAEYAKHFSFEMVGKMFINLYKRTLNEGQFFTKKS